MNEGRHIEIRGTVQGVGFRPFVYGVAQRLGLEGRVRNDDRGVIIDAFGPGDRIDGFLDTLVREAPPAARVRSIEWTSIPYLPLPGFAIETSEQTGEHRVSIPADLATCDDCLNE